MQNQQQIQKQQEIHKQQQIQKQYQIQKQQQQASQPTPQRQVLDADVFAQVQRRFTQGPNPLWGQPQQAVAGGAANESNGNGPGGQALPPQQSGYKYLQGLGQNVPGAAGRGRAHTIASLFARVGRKDVNKDKDREGGAQFTRVPDTGYFQSKLPVPTVVTPAVVEVPATQPQPTAKNVLPSGIPPPEPIEVRPALSASQKGHPQGRGRSQSHSQGNPSGPGQSKGGAAVQGGRSRAVSVSSTRTVVPLEGYIPTFDATTNSIALPPPHEMGGRMSVLGHATGDAEGGPQRRSSEDSVLSTTTSVRARRTAEKGKRKANGNRNGAGNGEYFDQTHENSRNLSTFDSSDLRDYGLDYDFDSDKPGGRDENSLGTLRNHRRRDHRPREQEQHGHPRLKSRHRRSPSVRSFDYAYGDDADNHSIYSFGTAKILSSTPRSRLPVRSSRSSNLNGHDHSLFMNDGDGDLDKVGTEGGSAAPAPHQADNRRQARRARGLDAVSNRSSGSGSGSAGSVGPYTIASTRISQYDLLSRSPANHSTSSDYVEGSGVRGGGMHGVYEAAEPARYGRSGGGKSVMTPETPSPLPPGVEARKKPVGSGLAHGRGAASHLAPAMGQAQQQASGAQPRDTVEYWRSMTSDMSGPVLNDGDRRSNVQGRERGSTISGSTGRDVFGPATRNPLAIERPRTVEPRTSEHLTKGALRQGQGYPPLSAASAWEGIRNVAKNEDNTGSMHRPAEKVVQQRAAPTHTDSRDYNRDRPYQQLNSSPNTLVTPSRSTNVNVDSYGNLRPPNVHRSGTSGTIPEIGVETPVSFLHLRSIRCVTDVFVISGPFQSMTPTTLSDGTFLDPSLLMPGSTQVVPSSRQLTPSATASHSGQQHEYVGYYIAPPFPTIEYGEMAVNMSHGHTSGGSHYNHFQPDNPPGFVVPLSPIPAMTNLRPSGTPGTQSRSAVGISSPSNDGAYRGHYTNPAAERGTSTGFLSPARLDRPISLFSSVE
ncbi:hypothetical protein FA15DRAFT_143612 [Coprinopsis marcescibilis]|uniref:Uncharacterized protein n=1 Tax=Coprinopsis marcescibilis TaxID=230819 RepID=A0A5C3KIU3_COPMA|nr:hypothetical protein FA15DRAFT_143612 [Coprinopsis marcescibilis]